MNRERPRHWDPDFRPMGFGLSRDHDSACEICGAIVLTELKDVHRKTHRGFWKRLFRR